MKKKFKPLFLLLILAHILSITTFAAATPPTFSVAVDVDQVEIGDNVTLAVSIKDNPGISSFLLEVKYDTDLLICEESDIQSAQLLTSNGFLTVANPNYNGALRIVTVAAQDMFQNGTLFTVTFEAVAPGKCDFELEVVNVVSNLESINASATAASTTILGDTTQKEEEIPPVDLPEEAPELPAEEPTVPATQFSDVPTTHWAYTYIQNAVSNGLFSGIGNGQFGPALNVTRGMFVTTLYSSAGSPDVELSNFTDVPANAWYAKAVAWASQQGIVSGIGDNKFGPDLPITREQIALILFNYADGVSPGTEAFVRAAYPDGKDIHNWALTAFTWAMNKELISGKSGNILDPLATATRAEVAVIMQNFVNLSK